MENEEMLEQTNETENVETQTTEENEEGIELTDTTETTESDVVDNSTSNDETVKEETKEVKKSLRELLKENPEYQEEYNTMLKSRLDREDRKHQKELSKYRDTDNVLRSTLNLKDGEDTNTKLREYYEADGVKLPEPIKPGLSSRENEILGFADADEFIEDGYDSMTNEANRLAKIGYQNMNERERACFNKLAENLTYENDKRELLKLGAKEELLTNKLFNDFRKQFNSNVPIKKIYEMYMKEQPKPKVENPGSLKNDNTKPNKDFISEEEYDKMSREEVRENLALIEKSMSKW